MMIRIESIFSIFQIVKASILEFVFLIVVPPKISGIHSLFLIVNILLIVVKFLRIFLKNIPVLIRHGQSAILQRCLCSHSAVVVKVTVARLLLAVLVVVGAGCWVVTLPIDVESVILDAHGMVFSH